VGRFARTPVASALVVPRNMPSGGGPQKSLTFPLAVKFAPETTTAVPGAPPTGEMPMSGEGVPATAVSVNVIGEPVSAADAVDVFVPGAGPSESFAWACPLESLVTVSVNEAPGLKSPPPVPIANVTDVPATGFPFASSTLTTSGFGRSVPTVWN